jgi:hypothetical protein
MIMPCSHVPWHVSIVDVAKYEPFLYSIHVFWIGLQGLICARLTCFLYKKLMFILLHSVVNCKYLSTMIIKQVVRK